MLGAIAVCHLLKHQPLIKGEHKMTKRKKKTNKTVRFSVVMAECCGSCGRVLAAAAWRDKADAEELEEVFQKEEMLIARLRWAREEEVAK